MSNALGQRGEALFYVLITKSHGREKPLFRPQFLGDKWPTIDFIVELENAGSITPYFFVQVKTTRGGYTKKDNRLKIPIYREDMRKLALYPAPTYIVGIDEIKERGYILSANGEWLQGLSSFPTAFPLDKINQDLLWKEVKDYWMKVKIRPRASHFIDPRWR
jgi:hypothetical protein